jgi:hypothetical protein
LTLSQCLPSRRVSEFSGGQVKPGLGKTHLAVAIAYRALQNGFDALFSAELSKEAITACPR